MPIASKHLLAKSLLAATALSSCNATTAGSSLDGYQLTALSPLSTPRATHAIVRTEHFALLIGGCVRDGCEPGPSSATVDILALGDDERAVGQLLRRRVQPGAVTLDGDKALIVGGWVDGRTDASTEVFDASMKRSVLGPTMASPRSSASVVRLADSRVLIVGGWNGSEPLRLAEIFDPVSNTLSRVGDLNQARSGATATLLQDGRVLIAGGGTGDGDDRRALSSSEIFDPKTRRFVSTGDMLARRYKHGAVALPNGGVLVIGGSDERDYFGKTNSVERFDPITGKFRAAGRLAEARFKIADGSVLLPSGKILVAGGFSRPELFDPTIGTSSLLPVDLGGQWNYLTATLAGSDVLLAGGYREGLIQVSNRVWRLTL